MENFRAKAIELDKKDSLSGYKKRFVDDGKTIYLDGNSLGKLPKETIKKIYELVENQWGKRLIRSWNENWIQLSEKTAKKIAPIVGANADEIFVGDSTSLNLYKLAYSALAEKQDKSKIVSDDLNFPTDLYILQGLVEQQFKEHSIELMQSADGMNITDNQLEHTIDEQTALVTLSHVAYKSAFMYNMAKVNRIAHEKGSFVIWDLSHAAGAVSVELNKTNADMAVGCTYKYLNGGPGAPAFLYVRKDLQEKLKNPINSWFSHQAPFDFDLNYRSSRGVQKFAAGTPNILSMAAIEPGLDIILEAGMQNLREKSVQQTDFLVKLITNELLPLGFEIASPTNSESRGSHVSIRHKEAYRINRAMIEPSGDEKVMIPDFRPPNNIRLGIAPLYISFIDIYDSVQRIKKIVLTKEYENFGRKKLKVT